MGPRWGGPTLMLAVLLGGAAGPVALRDVTPAATAEAVLARGKAASGLADTETLGQPFALVRNGVTVAALVSGRGAEPRLDGHRMTCFVAIVPPGPGRPDFLLTVGQWPWANQNCQGYTAIGLLPEAAGWVRIAIVYDGSAPNTALSDPVVLRWRSGHAPTVDTEATRLCEMAGATTIEQMRLAVRQR